jgi:hypothetical protein
MTVAFRRNHREFLRLPGDGARDSLLVGLLSFILFLFVNPFLALFLLALISMLHRVPALAFIVPASIAFAVFFYSREYGIDWYPGSTDDIPQYIQLYQTNQGVSLFSLLQNFAFRPSGNEPLWQVIWWTLLNGLGGSDNTFVFLHYLLNFFVLFLALRALSARYFISFALVYLFLIPISVDGLAHIFRQELSSFIFLAGVGIYLNTGRRVGKLFIYLSPLFHLSSLFWVAAFILFENLRKRGLFENRKKISFILLFLLLVCPIMLSITVAILDSLGVYNIVGYFEGRGVDKIRVYLLIGAYGGVQLLAFFLLRHDDLNHLILIMCVAVYSLVIALPAANGIYDRLLMTALPLLSVYLFRCILENFHVSWRVPSITVIFSIGLMRLYASSGAGNGPGAYLAFGNAFDPSMGLIKTLFVLFSGT